MYKKEEDTLLKQVLRSVVSGANSRAVRPAKLEYLDELEECASSCSHLKQQVDARKL